MLFGRFKMLPSSDKGVLVHRPVLRNPARRPVRRGHALQIAADRLQDPLVLWAPKAQQVRQVQQVPKD